MPNIGFLNGTYISRSRGVNTQECVNWYPETYNPNEQAKASLVLYPTPGLKLFVSVPNKKPVRGIYTTSNDRFFCVAGSILYEVSAFGKIYERGTLDGKYTSRVNFADNGPGNDGIIFNSDGSDSGQRKGLGMIIVDGFNGYMFNLTTNTLKKIDGGIFVSSMTGIVDANNNPVDYPGEFVPCSHVVFINGRFVVNQIGSQTFRISEIYDGFHWDPSNIFSAEGLPDNISGLATINNELWLLGDQSSEVFYDSGTTPGIYQRIHGALFNNGTIAPNSIAVNGANIFWLGSSAQGHGQVWTSTNYQPQKISTPSIDFIIENLPNIQDAVGFCYTQGGHNFYILTFTEGNRTLCFDLTTGLWHERGAWNIEKGTMDRFRVNCACFFNGKNYVGDYQNGNIYELSYDDFTDNGEIVRRVRVGSHIHADRKRMYFNGVEIDIERGVGLANPTSPTSQGIVPMIMLQWSNNGGANWSDEDWITLGAVGEYISRAKWTRMGMSRDRIFKVTLSDPNKAVLIAAVCDISTEK
jgi:hypothetical protein